MFSVFCRNDYLTCVTVWGTILKALLKLLSELWYQSGIPKGAWRTFSYKFSKPKNFRNFCWNFQHKVQMVGQWVRLCVSVKSAKPLCEFLSVQLTLMCGPGDLQRFDQSISKSWAARRGLRDCKLLLFFTWTAHTVSCQLLPIEAWREASTVMN